MEALVPFLVNLISGAVCGNIAGAGFRKLSLGVMGNTLAGLVGGSVAGELLTGLSGGHGGLAISSILVEILAGGIGGAICTLVVGLIRKFVAK